MRRDGWEARLVLAIEDARERPYQLGQHDCFRLACRVIEALTGVDRWPEFRGYATKREALALLARHGATFEDAFDWMLGPRVGVPAARRGDLVCVQTDDGEKHLGVVMGREAAFLAPAGVIWVPVSACLCAWRVG